MGAVATAIGGMNIRESARIRGGVQGVGFRPFVYTLAQSLELTGHVGNDSDGVFIEVEGDTTRVHEFFVALTRDAPARARIESVSRTPVALQHTAAFSIVASARHGATSAADTRSRVSPEPAPTTHALVQPDIAVCEACLAELRDPIDRRFGYPFINCSHCGPRYTIVRALPYDRAATTMSAFTMCDACQAEYDTPSHRRFHAQPNACATCGPRLWYEPVGGEDDAPRSNDGPIVDALRCLASDGTIGVKGIGGMHLACDATSDLAVQRLRDRKRRPHKPLAVMVADIDTARACAHLTADEQALLTSAERPIVLVRARADSPLSSLVAPGQDEIGVMLPYTPLHHMLLTHGPLVMTSGNVSDEPIAYSNEDARARLSVLCDGLLLHDREIAMPCDDSVIRMVDEQEMPIRRSRGYAPYPVSIATPVPSVLAIGGELKSTICLTRDAHAFLSPHIGDVGGLETRALLSRTIDRLTTLLEVVPVRVACDAHPQYSSSMLARAWAAQHHVPVTVVQHHHAHVASLLAEHGLVHESIIGVAFDGTGYGTDGSVWGGEILVADCHRFERVGHLATTLLPGGDAAVRHPARVALAQMHAAGIAWDTWLAPVASTADETRRILRRQLEQRSACATSSSMGRLLDAIAALIGVRQSVSYEGQAAMELEALARRANVTARTGHADWYAFGIARADSGVWTFDGAPVLRALTHDLHAGRAPADIAWHVHAAIANAVVTIASNVRDTHTLDLVGLTGGVFQNRLLLELARTRLLDAGFRVLTHRRVPPNDGGLALGQAMIAASHHALHSLDSLQ